MGRIDSYAAENTRKLAQNAIVRSSFYFQVVFGRLNFTYLFNTSRMLAAIFTLSTAKTTPALEALVPDFDDLAKEAIQCIELWAGHCEAADTVISMLKTIRQKVRVLVRGA